MPEYANDRRIGDRRAGDREPGDRTGGRTRELAGDGRTGGRDAGERNSRGQHSDDGNPADPGRRVDHEDGGEVRTGDAAFAERVAALGERLGRATGRQRGVADTAMRDPATGVGSDQDGARSEGDRDAAAASRGMAYGMRMATELVAAVAVGGGIGMGLDRWLGSGPWLFLVFFLLGFAAGVMNVVRAYNRLAREIAAAGRNGGMDARS